MKFGQVRTDDKRHLQTKANVCCLFFLTWAAGTMFSWFKGLLFAGGSWSSWVHQEIFVNGKKKSWKHSIKLKKKEYNYGIEQWHEKIPVRLTGLWKLAEPERLDWPPAVGSSTLNVTQQNELKRWATCTDEVTDHQFRWVHRSLPLMTTCLDILSVTHIM